MKNSYLQDDDNIKMIVMYHDEPVIVTLDTTGLNKAKSLPGTWKIKNKNGVMHVYQNVRVASTLIDEITVYLKDLVMSPGILEEAVYNTDNTLDLRPSNLSIRQFTIL